MVQMPAVTSTPVSTGLRRGCAADGILFLMRMLILSLAVVTACVAVAAADDGAVVFAHYTTWFSLGESTDIRSWPPDELPGKLSTPMPRYPRLNDEGTAGFGANHGYGGYNAVGRATMLQHIAWAKEYGIDVFAFLWDGPPSRFTAGIEAFRAVNTNMPWIVFYDPNIRFGRLAICSGGNPGSAQAACVYDLNLKVRDGDTVKELGEVLVADFKAMQQNGWFNDPNYYRADGRPVVWIYQAGMFSDQSATDPNARFWYEYLDDIRSWYWTNVHTELFLVGNLAGPGRSFSSAWDPYVTRFDAVSGWSPYYSGCPRDPSCECCRPRTLTDEVRPTIATWADSVPRRRVARLSGGESDVEFAPFIMPQFDDQWTKGAGKPRMIATSKEDFRYMAEKLGRDLLRGRRWIFLSTFNAWPESTTVEPCCDWKGKNCEPDYTRDRGLYGFDFLEVIREVFGSGS